MTLYVDGKKVGEGAIPMTQAMIFSADDGCDVGEGRGAPVSPGLRLAQCGWSKGVH